MDLLTIIFLAVSGYIGFIWGKKSAPKLVEIEQVRTPRRSHKKKVV